MAKPTRKHLGLSSIAVSPQGVEFLKLISAYLGSEITYRPLATFERGRRHLFILESPHGTALLSEAWEEPDGAKSKARWAFATLLADGQELVITLDARRWSAGQELVVTGVDPFPGVSSRRRKELEAQRCAEIGAAEDKLDERISVPGAAWSDLSGIGRTVVERELAQHGISLLATGDRLTAGPGRDLLEPKLQRGGDAEASEGERRALAALLHLPPPMPCPACGSPTAVPLEFGLPIEPLFRAAQLGLVALGGCIVGEDPPTHNCLACRAEVWRDGRHKPAGWYHEQLYRPRPQRDPDHETEFWIRHRDGTQERLDGTGPST
jgi:hypothetical protein